MDCKDVETVVNLWENDGEISHEDVESLGTHLENCSICRKKYHLLYPLIRRDASVFSESENFLPPYSSQLTQNIMHSLESDTHKIRRIKKNPSLLYAAAALLVVSIGLNFFFQSNRDSASDTFYIVEFTVTAPTAESVVVVGDFTDWEEGGLFLNDSDGDGVWMTEVKLEKGNIYKYNFIIDDDLWITDPLSSLDIDDGFGGKSSLMQL